MAPYQRRVTEWCFYLNWRYVLGGMHLNSSFLFDDRTTYTDNRIAGWVGSRIQKMQLSILCWKQANMRQEGRQLLTVRRFLDNVQESTPVFRVKPLSINECSMRPWSNVNESRVCLFLRRRLRFQEPNRSLDIPNGDWSEANIVQAFCNDMTGVHRTPVQAFTVWLELTASMIDEGNVGRSACTSL